MAPRKKQDALLPSTDKELKDTLWKAADKLRGSMDASQYKDVVLGLVFLKYVSDAFTARASALTAELTEAMTPRQSPKLWKTVTSTPTRTSSGWTRMPAGPIWCRWRR